MSNGNAEWMPLYIGDYLGDTMELDGPQHGAYLLLLMYYWRNGPLPLDDAKLAQIGRTDIRVWKKTVGPVVRGFFHERDGRLHQKRVDRELAKADSISAKRRAAAEARWTNGAPPPHPNGEDANAYANASGLHPVCTTDADANGMLRAPASPLPVQKKEPPLGPPHKRGGRSRADKPRFKAGIFQLIADEGSSVTEDADEKVTPIDRFKALANVRRRVAG